MVDGKPTRSVLTALCQRVAMRLGELLLIGPKNAPAGFCESRTGRLLWVQDRGASVYLRWAQSPLFAWPRQPFQARRGFSFPGA